jgi:hypothetical protein
MIEEIENAHAHLERSPAKQLEFAAKTDVELVQTISVDRNCGPALLAARIGGQRQPSGLIGGDQPPTDRSAKSVLPRPDWPAGVVKILPEYELITLMLMGHPVRPRKIALTVHLDCAEIGERGN